MSAPLAGKAAIIVGGSGGVGAATARALAEAGARVAVGYRHGRERAEALLPTLAGEGHAALPVDVLDTPSIEAFRDAALDRLGRADVLVNAAGTTTPIPHADLDALTDPLLDEVLASNVRGPFATIRAFAPALRAAGDSAIVNVSSIAAFKGFGSSIAYCAAKAALDSMTHTLALALGPEIRVLSVSPGVVATGFVPGRTREFMEKAAAATPLKRVVEPSDVAETILAAIVHMRLTTGVRLTVDGGRSL